MSVIKLPEKGMSRDQILSAMKQGSGQDADWRNGKTWSLVYHADAETLELAKEAYLMFFSENGLNPMAFPSLKKFETEVIAMTAAMLGGGPEAVGNMTTGGTESILLAVKAARDWAREKKPQATAPEMILPLTAHPAFEKAGHYFGVKSVHIPVTPDFRAEVAAAAKAITANTILIAGSAVCFPYGVIDPIPELAGLAQKNHLWFHADACLGGFMLPFLKKLGRKLIPFDFSVPGVCSISADIHKYGYGPKGASTVVYRNSELRKFQFFVYADFPGGVYASPTMTGTRAGGALAASWAVLNHLGETGYLELADRCMKVTAELMAGINAIPGLKVMGEPDMSVFAFNSDTLNMFELGELMEKKGWHLDTQQLPPALHLIVTPHHARIVEPFLRDLAETTGELMKKGKTEASGMAAIYGMIGTLPDRKAAAQFVLAFLDDLFKVK
jgi:glutamate/tyrosine decarboxylase-like PLP-dependent enzyme